jgi:hypothetical protein
MDICRPPRHFDADCKHAPRNYPFVDQTYALEREQEINSRIEHCSKEAPPPAVEIGHSTAVVGKKIRHIRAVSFLLAIGDFSAKWRLELSKNSGLA